MHNMVSNTVSSITSWLAKHNIIEVEDKELYSYGMQQGIMTLINFAAALAIGFAFNMVWQTVVFTLAYTPVRIYAGGYHSKTQLRCFIVSIVLLIAVLLDIRYSSELCLIMQLTVSMIIIVVLSPVQDNNKPLSSSERIIYKRKAIIHSAVLFVISLTFAYFNFHVISSSIILSLTASAFMLVLGAVKNRFLVSQSFQ